MSLSVPSTNGGMHSTSTSMTVRTMVFTALPMAEALPAIISHNFINPSPMASIMPIITPLTIATRLEITSVNEPAKAVMPADTAANPRPKANKPDPAASIPMPIRVNAPASPNIAGIIGARTYPAMPMTVNAPAIEINPLAIPSQLSEAKLFMTEAKIFMDTDSTKSAALVLRRPLDALELKKPSLSFINIDEEPPMILVNAPIINKIPAIADPALDRPSQLVSAKSLTTDANIFIEAAIITRPAPVDIM